MMDIPKLQRLARQLHRRFGHLKPQADRCFASVEICRPSLPTARRSIALSGFECATLMWIHCSRFKAVLAEIKRRKQGE
jgi:hypothetical protein